MSNLCNFAPNAKLGDLLSYITCIISKSVIPLIFALTIVMFLWGVVQFVIKDSEEAKDKGRQLMVWGIIGLTVMVGVWSIVGIVARTFNIDPTFIPQLRP